MQGWCLDDCREALSRCYLELDSARPPVPRQVRSVSGSGHVGLLRASGRSAPRPGSAAKLPGLATANRVSRPLALESFEAAGQETLKFVHGAVARFYVGGGVMGDRDGV